MTVMTGTLGNSRAYDAIDLSSIAFWSTTAAERERSFAVLRAERPVSWHAPIEESLMHDPNDHGYWAVTRRSDIAAVSRNNEVFLSGNGVIFENVPVELLEASQSFLAMDAPRHTKLRKLVSAAFTPRQVRRIEDSIKSNAKTIVEELRAAGSGADFVDHCAKELPIRTLSDMVGATVHLKFENLQFTAAYKERGALNGILCLNAEQRSRGVIAASAGN